MFYKYFRSLPVMMDNGFTSRHKIIPARKMTRRRMAWNLQIKENHIIQIGKQTSAIVINSIIDAMKVFINGNI